MWIDAHHHLWDPSVRPQTWMDTSWPINRPFDAEDLRAAIEGTPVEATIVVQTEPSIKETAEMLEVAATDPLVCGVVGWLDLHDDANRQLDDLAASQADGLLVGVRHQSACWPPPTAKSPTPPTRSRPDSAPASAISCSPAPPASGTTCRRSPDQRTCSDLGL